MLDHIVTIQMNPLVLKRGYIFALFLEDDRWIKCITKYWMIVPGDPQHRLHKKQDLVLKEKLADQIHPSTYQQRKDYYEAWVNVQCCAEDCYRCCDECHGIRFEPVPQRIAKVFDPDVRRFIEKYQRFWLTSEQEKALKEIREDVVYGDGGEVSNQADRNDPVWNGERKGIGRLGELKEDSSNPYQRQKESFLWPRPGEMAFEKSFEYWGQ